MSNIKPPQHDLYERIGKVTVDGRTKAYKEAVARLQNAAEIRQQRKDAAALSQGHSDGHHQEEGLAGTLGQGAAGAVGSYLGGKATVAGEKKLRKTKTGEKALKKLDMGEDIDESPAVTGIRMGARLVGKGARQLRNPTTRSMGKKTIGHGARVAKKGISKSGAAAGKTIRKDADTVGKAISRTSTGQSVSKGVSKGIKKVTPKTAIGREAAKGAAIGGSIGTAAGAAVNKARGRTAFTGKEKEKKTESLEIEKAIEERVLEILGERGIVDESVAALKGIRRGGRIIRKGVATARSGRKLPGFTGAERTAARTASLVKGGSEIARGAKTMKTAAGHANKATKAGVAAAGLVGVSQTKTAKKLDAAGAKALKKKHNADNKKKSESIKKEGLVGAAALVGTGVAIGRKSKERKVKVQKGTTHWDDNK